MMIGTLALLCITGLGISTAINDVIGNENNKLEGKIQLIFKRSDVSIENKEVQNGKKQKLYPKLVKMGWEGKNRVFYYKLATGMTYLDVLSKLPNLWDGLNAEVIPKKLEADRNSDFTLTVLNGHLFDRIDFDLDEMLEVIKHKKGELIVPVGFSRRKYEVITLSDDSTPTVLVGGTIGSGKSTWIRLVVMAIHYGYTPDEVEIWSCDMKQGVDLGIMGNSVFVAKRIINPLQALDFFQDLLKEAQNRYELLKKYNCTNVNQFNKLHPDKFIKRILLLIDEYSLLEGSKDPEENKYYNHCKMLVKQIVAISRAAAIQTILSTQRPSVDILEGTLKNNLACTIAFRTRNEISSKVLLDDQSSSGGKCAHIDPDKPGRAILKTDRELFVQIPYVDSEIATRMLLPFQRQNFENSQEPEYAKSV